MPLLLNGQNFLSVNYPEGAYVFLARTKTETRKLFPHFTLREYELILYNPIDNINSEFYIIRQPGINQYYETTIDFLNNIIVFYIGQTLDYVDYTYLHTKTNTKCMRKWYVSTKQPITFTTNIHEPQPCSDWDFNKTVLSPSQKLIINNVSMFIHVDDYKQINENVETKQQTSTFTPNILPDSITVEPPTILCLNSLEKGQNMYLIFPYKSTISQEELIKNLKTTTDENAINLYAQMLIGVTGKVQVAKVIKEYRAPKDMTLGEYELNEDGEFVPV